MQPEPPPPDSPEPPAPPPPSVPPALSGVTAPHSHDLTRTVFAVLFLAVLIGGSLWVLTPFIGPAIWAVTLVVATWGLMRRVQALLWGRRSLAVAVMVVALVLLVVVPLVAALITIVENADQLGAWAKQVAEFEIPEQPPSWLSGLPLVGDLVSSAWASVNSLGLRDLLPRLSPYAGNVTRWFVAQVGSLGAVAFEFLVIIGLAGVLYATGEHAAALVRRFASRLAGPRGESAVQLAGEAILGVAIGVGGTAVVQAVLAGLGLFLAGVPFAGLLTAVGFFLSIVQVGPVPVLLGAAAWAFMTDATGWGIALLVWSGVVGTLDNVIRPLLVQLGADLPFLLIFAGVIGGLLAFGLVGIFVGPVVLAVAWTLLQSWMDEGDEPPVAGPPQP